MRREPQGGRRANSKLVKLKSFQIRRRAANEGLDINLIALEHVLL